MEDNEFGDFAGFSSTSSGEGNLGKLFCGPFCVVFMCL